MKMVLKIALIVAVILATRYVFAQGYLSEVSIQQFVNQAGPLAIPSFVAIAAFGLLVFLPPALLVGSGTLAFGSTVGAICSWLGLLIGANMAFLLGRYIAADFAQRRKIEILQKLNGLIESHGIVVTIGLRLIFFANPVLNYAVSQTSLRFRDYAYGSAIGCVPGVFIIPHIVSLTIHAESLTEMVTHPAFYSLALLRLSGAIALFVLFKSCGHGKPLPFGLIPTCISSSKFHSCHSEPEAKNLVERRDPSLHSG